MHLRVSHGIHPADKGTGYASFPFDGDRLQEMRKFVRSLRDPWERQVFCMTVKYLFNELRHRHRTHVKWQDYVASVRANVAAMKKEAA